MAYIPRGIDNSTGGFEFPVSKRFGPLSGEIVGLSYGYGSWYQILRNDDYADYNRARELSFLCRVSFGQEGCVEPSIQRTECFMRSGRTAGATIPG